MARKSQSSPINHLVAITASMALTASGMAAPTLASASTAPAHAAKVAHHAAKAAHRSTRRHRSDRHAGQHSATTSAGQASAVAAPSSVAASSDCANAGIVPAAGNLDLVRAATLCLINERRAAAGLPALGENRSLDDAAQAHCDDMVTGNYFDHVAPSGVDPLGRLVAAGFATLNNVLDFGENIAASPGPLASPAATVAGWMSSAPHRANILDPTFRQTGIGVTPAVPAMLGIGGSGATYTQTFSTTA